MIGQQVSGGCTMEQLVVSHSASSTCNAGSDAPRELAPLRPPYTQQPLMLILSFKLGKESQSRCHWRVLVRVVFCALLRTGALRGGCVGGAKRAAGRRVSRQRRRRRGLSVVVTTIGSRSLFAMDILGKERWRWDGRL